MKNNNNQKEILLVLNTCFFTGNWRNGSAFKVQKSYFKAEELLNACWSGLIPNILPECFEQDFDASTSLWEINGAEAFIHLNFCWEDSKDERRFSVNPYVFMEVQGFN